MIEDEELDVVRAAAKELINHLWRRGLSEDQCLRALILLSSATMAALHKTPAERMASGEAYCKILMDTLKEYG